MSLFEKIINAFSPQKEPDNSTDISQPEGGNSPISIVSDKKDVGSSLTNQRLLDLLKKFFEDDLLERSGGRRMMYSMTYYIFMHPEDWNRRKSDVQFFIEEIVSYFYEVINSHRKQFPKFTPPANNWFFQFSKIDETLTGSDGTPIKQPNRGELMIMADIFPPKVSTDSSSAGAQVDVSPNIKVSVCIDNSRMDAVMDVNMAAISKIESHGQNTFTIKFMPDLGGLILSDEIKTDNRIVDDSTHINDSLDLNSRTRQLSLKWIVPGANANATYRMNVDSLIITNADDTLGGPNVLKINDSNVLKEHVKIRLNPQTDGYEFCAFQKVRFNGRAIQPSTKEAPVYIPITSEKSDLLFGYFNIQLLLSTNA